MNFTNSIGECVELCNTVDIYSSVLEKDLNTLHLSQKDKFWITESALRAIPFDNNDVRKWTALKVAVYLDNFMIISSPINYLSKHDKEINFFECFVSNQVSINFFLFLLNF